MIDDVQYMRSFLQYQDVEQNLPLPSDHFPRTDNIKKCKECTFRNVCQELKKHEEQQLFPRDEMKESVKPSTDSNDLLGELPF